MPKTTDSSFLTEAVSFCQWFFGIGFLLGTAATFYMVWGVWRLTTLFMPHKVYETGDDFLYSLYQKLVLFFYENLSGLEVILYGDVDALTKKKENVILMSNHQCTVDWMVANILAERQGSIGYIRYILKDSLKYLPLYGSYFRQHSCIYVKRSGKFQKDQAEMQLDELARNKTSFWMVVFPEGTRYRPDLPDVIAKSKAYAKEHGLPVYKHLLTPRSKALQLCFRYLRQNMDAVYDITIGYSDTLCVKDGVVSRLDAPSLSSFLKRRGRRIHIHLKRLPVESVPEDSEKFEAWLHERFQEKEKLLEQFYSNDSTEAGIFGSSGRKNQLPLIQTLPAFLFWFCINTPLWSSLRGLLIYVVLGLICSVISLSWAFLQR